MIKCVICGKDIEKSIRKDICTCSDKCSGKHYWNEHINNKDNKDVVRFNGNHYVIGDENSNYPFRGCGGRKFTIEFKDGRIVETTNLWCQGKIPNEYIDILYDNAVYIKENYCD